MAKKKETTVLYFHTGHDSEIWKVITPDVFVPECAPAKADAVKCFNPKRKPSDFSQMIQKCIKEQNPFAVTLENLETALKNQKIGGWFSNLNAAAKLKIQEHAPNLPVSMNRIPIFSRSQQTQALTF